MGSYRHRGADRALLLGVVGAFLPFVAPFAWREGTRALAEIDGRDRVATNRASAVAGRICGIAVTVVWSIVLALFVVLVLIGAVSSFTS